MILNLSSWQNLRPRACSSITLHIERLLLHEWRGVRFYPNVPWWFLFLFHLCTLNDDTLTCTASPLQILYLSLTPWFLGLVLWIDLLLNILIVTVIRKLIADEKRVKDLSLARVKRIVDYLHLLKFQGIITDVLKLRVDSVHWLANLGVQGSSLLLWCWFIWVLVVLVKIALMVILDVQFLCFTRLYMLSGIYSAGVFSYAISLWQQTHRFIISLILLILCSFKLSLKILFSRIFSIILCLANLNSVSKVLQERAFILGIHFLPKTLILDVDQLSFLRYLLLHIEINFDNLSWLSYTALSHWLLVWVKKNIAHTERKVFEIFKTRDLSQVVRVDQPYLLDYIFESICECFILLNDRIVCDVKHH